MSRDEPEYENDHVCRPLSADDSDIATNEDCYCCGCSVYMDRHYEFLQDDLIEIGPGWFCSRCVGYWRKLCLAL